MAIYFIKRNECIDDMDYINRCRKNVALEILCRFEYDFRRIVYV